MKMYTNQRWLTSQYQTQGKTAAQIAREQGVQETTIYNWLKKFELIKNSRKLSTR